ncbi:unnamed protein product [Ectocarpus sp. 12 AP-2014]
MDHIGDVGISWMHEGMICFDSGSMSTQTHEHTHLLLGLPAALLSQPVGQSLHGSTVIFHTSARCGSPLLGPRDKDDHGSGTRVACQ